ncbi:MAG: sodium ion-translocating decarboxylase subunit beta [Helicobacteraceae bacterium]|nr:sodium ion-translocating decarboxylase subunit beta [Helicobacteraceae bacterium]
MRKLFLSALLSAFAFAISAGAAAVEINATTEKGGADVYEAKPLGDMFLGLIDSTGVKALLTPKENVKNEFGKDVSPFAQTWGRLVMFFICFLLFYLGIAKQYEPLLLLPIAFGGLLANIPIADMAGPNGFLGVLYNMGISSGLFPLLIFMGVGAMTDFGPLLANPKTALLGGAAQFGIFGTLVLAVVVGQYTDLFTFDLKQAAAISIIGGADGPTSIFVASRLAPELLGAIAVAAYSYMALVPLIQPPIMRALTTKKEREIKMMQLREVSKVEKILFPISLVVLCALFLPDAAPLMGALCFGNLARECGVIERINDTLQNSLINIVTIFLGLSVGSKLAADKFLIPETLAIVVLGLLAFSFGTAAGVVMAKIMNKLSKDPINPLIGSAGVSAVPMAARVSQKEAQKANPHNFLLMHAMGPNVSGVIGSAVAAGVLLSLF